MTSTSVGWDPSPLMGQSWTSPLPAEAEATTTTTPASDASATIERTRQVPVDANDYSRFKHIGDDDADDTDKTGSNSAATAPLDRCRNCNKPGAKLKCSVCKKAVYCARTCQASDWKFHKRICKKPVIPEPKPKAPPQNDSAASSSTTASTTTTTTTSFKTDKTKAKAKPAAASSSSDVVHVDDPDLPAEDLRGYKNGLPYFHRELTEHEQNLIGDIAPKKVDAAEVVAPAAVAHEGSAWNAAGTFEERSMTKWAEQHWEALFTDKTFSDGPCSATFKAPKKVSGDASICVVRGRKRFLYDFTFTLPFQVVLDGTTYKGNYQMQEVSNDDNEISYSLVKKPQDARKLAVLQAFVGSRSSGLQKEVLRIIDQFAHDFQSQ